jgi:hypothetical protein
VKNRDPLTETALEPIEKLWRESYFGNDHKS